MSVDYVTLGERVRMYRREQGMTQEELAERAGISASFLGHVERGSRKLSMDTFAALCRSLQTTPNELLGLTAALPWNDPNDPLRAQAVGLLQAAMDILRRCSAE